MSTPTAEGDIMVTRSTRAGRVLVGLAAAALALLLAGCGGSDDEPSTDPTTSSSAADGSGSDGYPYDTFDTGDDLLSTQRVDHAFSPDASISWQFPTFYADGETDETSTNLEVDDVRYGVLVMAGTGTTPQAVVEKLAAQVKADADAIHEVTLDGRDWVALVDDAEPLSRVTLFGSFPGGVVAGATLTANTPLADVPPERIAELQQTVLSIQPADG